MDLTTILGLVGGAILLARGAASGEISSTFLNWHGLGVVLGGTLVAILINTPARYVWNAVRSLLSLGVASPYRSPEAVVRDMAALAEASQGRGISAFRDANRRTAGGFLAHAAEIALENNDPKFVRGVLEEEISQAYDLQNEVTNVYRSMGVLSPMFGLIGTLLGIVNVLKQISEPEQVGKSMAVAITSAFYGILMANLVCVPVAGKLRIRSWEEMVTKTIVLEGLILIMEGAVPAVVERRLQSFLAKSR